MVFHERKEESKNTEASKPKKATSDKPPEYNQSQVQASIFSHPNVQWSIWNNDASNYWVTSHGSLEFAETFSSSSNNCNVLTRLQLDTHNIFISICIYVMRWPQRHRQIFLGHFSVNIVHCAVCQGNIFNFSFSCNRKLTKKLTARFSEWKKIFCSGLMRRQKY